jgi:hypothetical protein
VTDGSVLLCAPLGLQWNFLWQMLAFAILDDMDDSTLKDVKPIYGCLRPHGLRAAKSVRSIDFLGGSCMFCSVGAIQRMPYQSLLANWPLTDVNSLSLG